MTYRRLTDGRVRMRSARSPAKTLARAAVALLGGVSIARPAFAYIDPGTTQVIWTTLAPVIGVLVACLAVALWPLRMAWRVVSGKWAGWSPAAKTILVLSVVVLLAAGGFGIVRIFRTPEPTLPFVEGPPPDADFEGAIVLGIDGLDPVELGRMMDEGKLPNFARLRSEGTFAPLQTSTPAMSPIAWTCAATGVNPGRHGIFGSRPTRCPPSLIGPIGPRRPGPRSGTCFRFAGSMPRSFTGPSPFRLRP